MCDADVHAHEKPGDDAAAVDHRRQLAKKTRVKIMRWAQLVLQLSVQHARGYADAEETKQWLESLGLLRGDEWSRMLHGGGRQLSVVNWIIHAVSRPHR